jgi:nitrate/nitrite transporter NarK
VNRAAATGRRRIYFGWWLVAAGVVLMAVTSGTSFWAFGLYIQPVEEQFGWSRATVSFGIGLSLLLSGLTAPLVGLVIDRFGPRRITMLGVVLTSASFLLVAATGSTLEWYLFLSLNAVVRNLCFYIPAQAIVARWFERRRGLALGLLGTGFSLGGLLLVPLLRVVMDAWDWDGALIFSAVLQAAVCLPLCWRFIHDHPSAVGQVVDGDARPRGPVAGGPPRLPGVTPRAALRTPLLWVLSFALGFLFYGMVGWMVHMVPYYESVGVSPGTAAGLVSLGAGLGMFGRVGFGLVADRIRVIEHAAAVVCVVLTLAFVALLVTGGSTLGIGLFLLFYLLGAAAGPMLEPLLLVRAFGTAHFATILGLAGVVGTVGMVISPTVGGAIFDSTGAYDWALVMWLSAVLLSGVLFQVGRWLPRPMIAAPEPPAAAIASPGRRSSGAGPDVPRPADSC